MRLALVVLILALLVAGCTGSEQETPKSTSTSATTTTSAPTTSSSTTLTIPTSTTYTTSTSSTTTTTVPAGPKGYVLSPRPGCECMQWTCPVDVEDTLTTSTSTVPTSSTTTTTCITRPYEDYEPQTRRYDITIKGQRFRPDRMDAFLGDTIVANITNKQGLHKLRDTYTLRTITILPEQTYEFIFYALETGEHQLTCNPFCEDPMEAKIVVVEPYQTIC